MAPGCVTLCATLSLSLLLSACRPAAAFWDTSDTPLRLLDARPGDQVSCHLWGLQTHWLLASDRPGFFLDVSGGRDKQARSAQVRELHWSQFGSAGVSFDAERCRNWGQGPNGGALAVAKARRLLGRRVPYSLLSCNCEHYVKAWAGDAGVNQALRGPSAECRRVLHDALRVAPPFYWEEW